MSLRSPAVRHAASWLGLLPGLVMCLFAGIAAPAAAAEFTDSAGRIVVLPQRVGKVMAASPTAEVLVYALAPGKLAGWTRGWPSRGLPARYARLPVIGRLTGPDPTATAATVMRVHPDLIVDSGVVTAERIAFADQLSQATGTPYILLDNSIERTPAMLRTLGHILGVDAHAGDLATFAEHSIDALRGRLLIQPPSKRVRVYYGRGPSGLETGLPGSPAAAAIDEAGAINVATALGRGERVVVTRAQLLQWNPDVIIAQERSFFEALHRDPSWRNLAAVRNKRVFLAPSQPFGWIDEPPGVNRLIGLYWLSVMLYPSETLEDVRGQVQDFYDKFYGVKLTRRTGRGDCQDRRHPAERHPAPRRLFAQRPGAGGRGSGGQRAGPARRAADGPAPVTTTPSYLMPK